MALNIKEQAFVHEYIINGGNAYQAALKAGYARNTAANAQEWLSETLINPDSKRHLPYKPELASAIQDELKKLDDAKIADEKEILEYLTSVMRREKTENVVVMMHEEETKYVPNPETGRSVRQTVKKDTPTIVEIPSKLSDANKAAELLGKVRRMFSERLEMDIAPVVLTGYDDIAE